MALSGFLSPNLSRLSQYFCHCCRGLIDLYEVWNKPEEAEEWRAKLAQTEAVNE